MIRRLVRVAPIVLLLAVAAAAPAFAQSGQAVFSVTSYGADATGATDSTQAVQATFAAAQASWQATGLKPEVYWPEGSYLLNDPGAGRIAFNENFPVDIVGHSRSDTTITDDVAGTTSQGQTIFELTDGGNVSPTPMGADGSSLRSLNLVSNQAGDLAHIYANDVSVDWIYGTAPYSSSSLNPNGFGIRVTATCNNSNAPGSPDPTVYHYGNSVSNVVITGYGKGGNVDIDVSCQVGATVDHVTDAGAGIALYKDVATTLDHYTYTGVTDQQNAMSWYIDGPGSGMVVENVTATGSGSAGRINPSPNDVGTVGPVLRDIQATAPGDVLVLGDATGVTVDGGSDVNAVVMEPDYALAGVAWSSSNATPAQVTCRGAGQISGLVGISCPPGGSVAPSDGHQGDSGSVYLVSGTQSQTVAWSYTK